MKITKDLFDLLSVKRNHTYGSYALPFVDKKAGTAEWGNNDEQFTVKFDIKTKEMTAKYYDYDEDKEDWVDGADMSDKELTRRIFAREFVLVSLA